MSTHARFVEDGEEGVLVDTTRHPTGKVLSVLWQLHVASTADSVWMNDGEIARFVFAGWWGGDTFWHGSR